MELNLQHLLDGESQYQVHVGLRLFIYLFIFFTGSKVRVYSKLMAFHCLRGLAT